MAGRRAPEPECEPLRRISNMASGMRDTGVAGGEGRASPPRETPRQGQAPCCPHSLEEQEEAGRAVGGGAEGRPAKPVLSTSARVKIRFREGECIPAFDRFHKKKKMCVWHKVNPEGRLEGWPLRPGLQTPSLWVTASAARAPQPGTGSGERGGLAGEQRPAAASPRGEVLPRVGCTELCGLGLWGREGWSLCRRHGSLVSARCACPCLSPRPP